MSNIKYISTRGDSHKLLFKDVLFEGLAPDGGLYIPQEWPILDPDLIKSFQNLTYNEIAFYVIRAFLDDSIADNVLKDIITKSYDSFKSKDVTPLVHIHNNEYMLELFHGPTMAFKDVAMQFIGNIMNHYLSNTNQKINILGATSGDTGAAAIEGFKNTQNCKIFILHPHNRISEVQKKFMTTVDSENVHNLAIRGSFDDCQNIIKEIFSDISFKKGSSLTAINSINWARIMCQTVYYFFAMSRLDSLGKKCMFTVPTGNFGDILAGYIAKQMGLNIRTLNIATNENDILTRTLNTSQHELKKVSITSSPSIDIQISSNFERLIYDNCKDSSYINSIMADLNSKGKYTLKKEILDKIKQTFCSYSIHSSEVHFIIKKYMENFNIVLDPHTAVAIGASERNSSNHDISITLSTAHPAKFKDTVSHIINNDEFVPDHITNMMKKDDNLVILDNNIDIIKTYLKENIL
tara:strand:- start:930 stop:2324 length:1395 start_codon:yes stop_codon:yes gene_type:complete